jgi:hypothetical protein
VATAPKLITSEEIAQLRQALQPLRGVQFDVLKIPKDILGAFEPSQIGTIIGTLMDACIPQLAEIVPENALLRKIGLTKQEGILGDREGYPDYKHESGKRLELKLLYVDPVGVQMKKPPTRREASARITQKVTVKNVVPATDVLLVIAYQLRANTGHQDVYSPTIIDLGLFPMIECVQARDHRLVSRGGKWFGNYETPAVLSKIGRAKVAKREPVDEKQYGRKESEGYDFNEDTNFGKLKRVPLESLQRFLKKHGATYARKGSYPTPWAIERVPNGTDENDDEA